MENNISKNSALGSILVVVGVAFLLSNLGLIPEGLSDFLFSWQVILILLGLVGLCRGSVAGGVTLILIGGIYLIPNILDMLGIDYSSFNLYSILWPAVIIFFGLWLIFHKRDLKKMKSFGKTHSHTTYDGAVNYDIVLNGIDEIFLGPSFTGGEINTIMGGAKLDLRRTKLSEGDTILKISSIMGGVTLLVPMDWNVVIISDSILGGFTDQRHGNGEYKDRRLVIKASFFLGGGSIE